MPLPTIRLMKAIHDADVQANMDLIAEVLNEIPGMAGDLDLYVEYFGVMSEAAFRRGRDTDKVVDKEYLRRLYLMLSGGD